MDDQKLATVSILSKIDDRSGLLQDELLAVINHEKYDDMKMSTIVGVLEFLKWNIINRC